MRWDSGQAALEAAIVLPAFLCLLLCTIQLTQIQQARLLLEYAAFNAARAGIVRDADNGSSDGARDGVLREAAVRSILPTAGRTDSWEALLRTLASFEQRATVSRSFGLEPLRVRVLRPRRGDFAAYGSHLDGQEIDFDDGRAADATLLSIEVSYLYELRVPFANELLHALWLLRRPERADAAALALAAREGHYLLPLEAFATMRMQSNPFLKWAAP